MRGEKQRNQSDLMRGQGSPPHARGKDIRTAETWDLDRITPACAGKSVD